MLHGKVVEATDGMKGFDTNTVVTPSVAAKFREAGFRFCIRYVRRDPHNNHDITEREGQNILSAGLGLMLVQHVDNPNWRPTGALGSQYGLTAALEAGNAGYPSGHILWCDLEGVDLHTPASEVISFCNSWYNQVQAHGYEPGLYVGYDPGLSASQLYYKLRFSRYWSAYNLNRDQVPLVRDVQLKQGVEKVYAGIRYDPDVCQTDGKGSKVKFLADLEWSA